MNQNVKITINGWFAKLFLDSDSEQAAGENSRKFLFSANK